MACAVRSFIALALLPRLAIAGHCYQSTVPAYCCSIGCDSSYTTAPCTGASPPVEYTLADIFAIATGCGPRTEGSCSYAPANLPQCTNSGLCGSNGCDQGVATPHSHTPHGSVFLRRGDL